MPSRQPINLTLDIHGRPRDVARRRRAGVALLLSLTALAGAAGLAMGLRAAPSVAGAPVAAAGESGASPVWQAAPAPDRQAAPAAADQNPSPLLPGARAAARMAWLPVLNFEGGQDVCVSWIAVQNLGSDLSKAVIVTWGEPGFCPPQAAGPLKVECSGLIKPGQTWNFLGAQVPTGSASGLVISFTARRLSEIGVNLGFDDVVADTMCEELFFGVVGDADDYRRFLDAFAQGAPFRGVPQDRAAGAPLAVEVARRCPVPGMPDTTAASAYDAVPGHGVGAPDDAGNFDYFAPLVRAAASAGAGGTTLMVQNAGLQCAEVQLAFRAQDADPNAPPCALEVPALAPGESALLDLRACAGGGPEAVPGSAWLRSRQPLAVVADTRAGETLSSYALAPAVAGDAAGSGARGMRYVAPLVYHDYGGWDTRVQVQNTDALKLAKVKAYYLDRAGDIITTSEAEIPPRASHSFDLAEIPDLPGNWIGAVRVESQEWWSPGTNPIQAPIAVVVESRRAQASGVVSESLAYGLPADQVPAADGSGGGQGLLGLPTLIRGLDRAEASTEIAIANTAGVPGFTDFALLIYDQNGLLDLACMKLQDRQVEYIDLGSLGFLNPGFKGSGVISATFWEHDVFDPAGNHVANLLGLSAVTHFRPAWSPGGLGGPAVDGDQPGDASEASLAIPISPIAESGFAASLPVAVCGLGPPAQHTATPWPTMTPLPTATPPEGTLTGTPTPVPTATPPPGTGTASATPEGRVTVTVPPFLTATPALPATPAGSALPSAWAGARLAWLPEVAAPGTGAACDPVVTLFNAGVEPSKALLITWDGTQAGACPPTCAGPHKVECSGLLRPGGSWLFAAQQMPLYTASGLVVSFNTRRLSEIGVNLGQDDIVADYMCENLFFGVVGDCEDYRRFVQALYTGGSFAGVPMDRALGAPLAVELQRSCPPPGADAPVTSSAYTAVTGRELGLAEADGSFHYFAPMLPGAPAQTHLSLQNAGIGCATVQVTYRSAARCGTGGVCQTLTIAPGERRTVDLAACAAQAGDAEGSAWLKSDQPLALVVDTRLGETLMSYTGIPARQGDPATGAPALGTLNYEVAAPLIYKHFTRGATAEGWTSRLHVQNTSRDTEAQVKVSFLDRSGDVLTTRVERICPLGSAVFDAALVPELQSPWVGAARIESQVWWTPGEVRTRPEIAVVVESRRIAAGALSEAAAWNAIPAQASVAAEGGGGGVLGGVGVIALPQIQKTGPRGGASSDIAIHNAVSRPGFTDFAIYIFDQNGILDYVCQKLNARQTEYINLESWGYVNPGFKGSAIVSASYWEHPVYDPRGQLLYDQVGLAAVTLDRPVWRAESPQGPAVDADGPGDASLGRAGIPLYWDQGPGIGPNVDLNCFSGPVIPTRPPYPTPTPFGGPGTPSTTPVGPATATAPPQTPAPGRAMPGAPPVYLPVLESGGQANAGGGSRISVQNVGGTPSKALTVFWGAPGACAPDCKRPIAVHCSGLIAPGATWSLDPKVLAEGAASAAVFSFTGRTLDEAGIEPRGTELVADRACAILQADLLGACERYGLFHAAYHSGSTLLGLPMGLAWGSPLAIELLRDTAGEPGPGTRASGGYAGITQLGAFDPIAGGYISYVPLIWADRAGLTSRLRLQNAGDACASVEVWFKAQDDCLTAKICEIATLAPGEAIALEASDCVDPGWQGSAWIRASQPLAAVLDTRGRNSLSTYHASLPPGITGPEDWNGNPMRQTTSPVLYAPLFYSEYQGWDTAVQVQNLNVTHAAKVKVYFLDRSGDIITTLVDWVCPRGSQTYFLPVAATIPGRWVGSVRVESQDWWTSPAEPKVPPPHIAGVAHLMQFSDAERREVRRMAAYNLLPEPQAFIWPEGAGAGGLESGVGLIAIPALGGSLGETPQRGSLAVANLVRKPGFTDFAVVLIDANGALDWACQRLYEGQAAQYDLARWGFITPDFAGGALVSAVYWEHPVFDAESRYLRNLVGLGAALVSERGSAGAAPGGDPLAVSLGTPLGRAAGAALAETLAPVSCAARADAPTQAEAPSAAAERMLHLPVLKAAGGDLPACQAWITVQSTGEGASRALLAAWGAGDAACGPTCTGPQAVLCSGLLAPGTSWHFRDEDLPEDASSGTVFSLTARTIAEVGGQGPPERELADYLCERLRADLAAGCAAFDAFRSAYLSGADYAGIPMDRARGASLVARLNRACPVEPGAGSDAPTIGAAINALTAADLGSPAAGPASLPEHAYALPVLHGGSGGWASTVHVQNAGVTCAEVVLCSDCGARRRCESFSLAPGQSHAVPAPACDGGADAPDSGFGWVTSAAPLAIAVDNRVTGEPGALTSYTARPRWVAAIGADGAIGSAPGGSPVLFAPLSYSEYQGWDQTVHVQNLAEDRRAKVQATFLDRSGDVVDTLVEWLRPGGAAAFRLPQVHNLVGNWVGSVRVESQPYTDEAGDAVLPPHLAGVIEMRYRRPDATGAAIDQAAAYELLGEAETLDWPFGSGSGGPGGGATVLAIPGLHKDLAGSRRTSELAIANLSPQPGFTDFAVMVFDANGLVDLVCQKLHQQQVEYLDLQTWGYVNTGFAGSAVISAVYWEHPHREGGTEIRDVVGLAAVLVERRASALGEDIPGDELALAPAIPLHGAAARAAVSGYQGAYPCPPPNPPTPQPTPTVELPPTPTPVPPATPSPSPVASSTAEPPLPSPTAPASATPARPSPTPLPPTSTPAPTATPLLPTATAGASTAADAITVCPGIEDRVPAGVLDEARAQPATIGGFGRRCNAALPAGPWNGYRRSLSLSRPNQAYHPTFNDLVLKCGCP